MLFVTILAASKGAFLDAIFFWAFTKAATTNHGWLYRAKKSKKKD